MANGDLAERRKWTAKWLVKLTDEQKQAKKDYERDAKRVTKQLKTLAKQLPAEQAKALLELYREATGLAKDEKYGQAAALMQGAVAAVEARRLARPDARPGPESTLQPNERFEKLEANRLLLQRSVEELTKQLSFFEKLAETDPGKQALVERLTRERDAAAEELKFARVDAEDPYRSALTQDTVRSVLSSISNKIDELKIDATDPRGPGLMEKLGRKLNKIVDEMISNALYTYLKEEGKAGVEGKSGKSYSQAMEELLKDGGEALFKKYPKMKEMIELETQQFETNMIELLEYAAKDQKELGEKMFDGKSDLVGLKDLIVADSDPHNHGRRVTILTFVDKSGQEHKVVNKPRDVRVDAKFVGMGGDEPSVTSKANEFLVQATLKKARLEERVKRLREIFDKEIPNNILSDEDLRTMPDEKLANILWPGEAQTRVKNIWDEVYEAVTAKDVQDQVAPLPGYKYLPKEPEKDGEHRYGWVEYVEHGRPEDFVVDEEGAKNYYRQVGRQTAMAILFGIEDIHQGNIMVSKGQPQLTDLEIAFSSKVSNPERDREKRFERLKADPSFKSDPKSEEELLKMSDYEVELWSQGRIKELSVLAKTDVINSLLVNSMVNLGLTGTGQKTYGSTSKVEGDRLIDNTTPEDELSTTPFDEKVKDGVGRESTDNQLIYRDSEGKLHSHGEYTQDNPRKQFGGELAEGFMEMIEAFSDPVALREMGNFVESFRGVQVRFHALKTESQLQLRRNVTRSGFSEQSEEEMVQSLKSQMKDKKGAEHIIDSMSGDLLGRDVAYYTQELGSKKLLHNGVDPVQEEGKDLDYFDTDGLEPVKERIALLGNPLYRQALLETGKNFLDAIAKHDGLSGESDEIVARTEELLGKEKEGESEKTSGGETKGKSQEKKTKEKEPKKDKSERVRTKAPQREAPRDEVEAPDAAALVLNDRGAPNPTLYFIVNKDGDYNLQVSDTKPGAGWQSVEQFCGVLSTQWLAGGGGGGIGFADLVDKPGAVQLLRNWASSGGLDAQVRHARDTIGGRVASKEELVESVRSGSPAGTKFWFGTTRHAMAATLAGKSAYRVYDPNTGGVESMNSKEFVSLLNRQSAFVVA